MREALARSDDDFVLSEPARARKAPPLQGFFGTLGAILRFAYRLAAYPNRIGGALVFALAIAILINALMLQHSRHPAPLFRKSVTLSVHEPAAAARQASAQRLASVEKAQGAAALVESAKPGHDPIAKLLKSESPAPREAGVETDKTKPSPHWHMREASMAGEARPAAHDPIAQMLKSNPSQEAAAEERPKTVLGVQRALVRLGFVVRPDGQMGAVTRHAIEQYERDHGLPIEARLTPRLLHRLAAETGIAIE